MAQTRESFTQLSKELILLVINYLPLIDAIKLCSLKREWIDLWIHKTTLEFDENKFIDIEKRKRLPNIRRHASALEMKSKGRRNFFNSVNCVIHRFAAPTFTRFSLRVCYQPMYYYAITHWIMLVVYRNVEELILDFSDQDQLETISPFNEPRFMLPEFLFDHCRSIKKLFLNSCHLGRFNSRNFTSLTNLSLVRIELSFQQVESLLRDCPLLKVLVLDECRRLFRLIISSSELSLERLVIRNCEPLSLGIDLWAPKLKFFEYSGGPMSIDVKTLDKLLEVVLNYGLDTYFCTQATVFTDILRGCSCAKVLTFCSYVFQIPHSDSYLSYNPPSKLIYLEDLTLKVCLEGYELTGIFILLGNSPNLQTLSIHTGFIRDMNELIYLNYPPIPYEYWYSIPRLSLGRLHKIKLEGFTGSQYEMHLLRVLVINAFLLQKLIIIPKGGLWINLSEVTKALHAEKTSRSLKIVYG